MRRLELLVFAGWLAFAAAGVWAVPSQPPLVPEGEVFDDVEALLAAVSRSSPVNSIAFSPDGKTLASGSDDGTVRLWSKGKENAYRASQVFLSGQRGTWIGCRSDGKCLRHDDGTLLVRKNDRGRLEPLAPPSDATPELELVTVPTTLETNDGSATPFTLKVRNNGTGRAFWINVRRAAGSQSDPLVFHPPPTQSILDPGVEAELACRVSTHSAYENPKGRSAFLALEVTSAHSEPIVGEPILVQGKIPRLEWNEAHWSRDGEEVTLSISLTNAGEQDLSLSEFSAELVGFERIPGTVRRAISAGERVTIPFATPEDFEADEDIRVTLVARKLEHPIHEWTIADKTVLMPRALWPLYLALTLFLLVGTGLCVAALQHYRHPLVAQLSDSPKTLATLAPEQLRPAQRLLRRIRRLDSVLAAADVHSTWLDAAIAFTADPDPESCCRHLSERLGIRPEGPHADDPALWILPLGPSFPLNLERCFLYLPPVDRPPADVETTLRQRPETHDQVTLVVSADPGHQEKLHRSASDPGNLWVAPSGAQLTGLLLAADPVESLARLVASQVRLTRISPYQTGGGTDKAAMFFGRDQILAHILNREPANYLVVGGRQVGKSSLLKAIDRSFGNRPDARCHYLVLRGSELAGDLARAVGLPRETGLDEIVAHLTADDRGRRFLLIDEADRFIRAERGRDYPTLHHLRALSELGRCHFILAGFWDLYEAVAFDYQSPLRNFGETLTIGALEADACRALATRPMATMHLGYEAPELVERLVAATGQRANLVSIACNEILKNLDPKDRTIHAADVDRALAGKAIHNALGGWKNLAGDDAGNRLDRILVYATIRRQPFTLADALRILEEKGQKVPPDRVERSLERLELAFVLGREDTRYRYQVPLFEKMVLAQEPEMLLERELASGEGVG